MSTKNRTRENNPQHPLSANQMIEQINIALEQKGSGNFWPGSLKPAVGDYQKREQIYITKSDEE